MAYTKKELTADEKEAFLQGNWWGILSFAGDEPYAIPLGYQYKKGAVILGFPAVGKKMGYVNKSRNVCFTICRPAALSPDPKESYPYTTIIIEGELEEITDRAYYGLGELPKGIESTVYRIKEKEVGTQKLDSTP